MDFKIKPLNSIATKGQGVFIEQDMKQASKIPLEALETQANFLSALIITITLFDYGYKIA